ncbi:hypothetical protein P3S67_005626 [Capsicum chacoense]
MLKVCLFFLIKQNELFCFPITAKILISLKTSRMDLTDREKIEHLHYLIITLLPLLKEIHHEQIQVIEPEFCIRGLSSSSVEIKRSLCHNDERVYCNN